MISTGETVPNRVIPAQQRFASRDPPRLQIDQWLVINLEFFIGERLTQIEFEHAARLDRLGHLVAEEAERAAAGCLGAVQRHIGILQEMVSADIGFRQGNTDTGADFDLMIVDLVALAEPFDDAARQIGGIMTGPDGALEDHEFVTTETGDEIIRAQHLA